jgi:hypothetical protein
MSSIERISGSSSGLSLLQQLLARQQATASSTTSLLGSGSTTKSNSDDFETKLLNAAVAAGLSTDEVDSVQSEIEDAIAAAKQNSGSSTDQGATVRSAIDGVLQKHGVNLEKFRTEMQSSMGGPGGAGGPPPGGPPPGGPRGAGFESKFNDAAVSAGLDASKTDELQSKIQSLIGQTLQTSDGTTDPRQTIQSAIDSLLKDYGVDLTKFKSQMQSSSNGMSGAIPLLDEQA